MANPQLGIGNLMRNSAFGAADDPLGGDLLDAYARLQRARGYPGGDQASAQPDQWRRAPLARVDQPVIAAPLFAPQGLSTQTPSAPFDPVTATVNRGATVEGIARNRYGDDWRAGVGAIMSGNGLRTNAYGSPVLGIGQEVRLPSLGDRATGDYRRLEMSGGQTVANNQAGLAEAQRREQARLFDGSRYSGVGAADFPTMATASYRESQAIEAAALERARAATRVAERFVPRTQWGAKPPIPGNLKKQTAPYDTVTLHHTGRYDTPGSVQDLHLGSENWWRTPAREAGFGVQDYVDYGDTGYNFMIGENGEIYQGRSPNALGAHTIGHNPGNLGVAVLGDYSNQPMNPDQLASVRALMTDLGGRYPIADYATHGEFDQNRRNELRGALPQISYFLANQPIQRQR